MKKLFLSIFILSGIILSAQEKKAGYKFHSVNSLTLLNGSHEVSAAIQSVNGFRKGSWFAGIGVGIDYYIFRSIPLFADLQYEFGKKKNKFFFYADGGVNICWKEDFAYGGIVIWDQTQRDIKYSNGLFADLGLGYKIKMRKENALVLSLGQSHKALKESNTYINWRTQKPQTDFIHYKLNRIALKLGWQF